MSSPISGFMPIPLAIMPPFMAYQSLVMGDAFGRAFQFGKRKISAMSNEEFNKLDIVQLYEGISNEYTRIIPTVEKAMAQSTDLQVAIVTEMLKIIPALAKELFGGITEAVAGGPAEHILHGHIFGHKDEEEKEEDTEVDSGRHEKIKEEARAKEWIIRIDKTMNGWVIRIAQLKKDLKFASGKKKLQIARQLNQVLKIWNENLKPLMEARKAFHKKYGYWV